MQPFAANADQSSTLKGRLPNLLTLQRRLHKTMTAINKNRQKVSFYQWKKGQYDNQTRRAETRTKIQLGGLIFKSGLTDYLNICAGDDLQLDATKWDEAAILLGMLLEGYETLLHDKHHNKLNHWKLLGTQAMKYNHAMIDTQTTYDKG